MDKNKKEKSPWLKAKKKMGPKFLTKGGKKVLLKPIKALGLTSLLREDDQLPSTNSVSEGTSQGKLRCMSKESDDDSVELFSEDEETADDPVWTVVDRQDLNLLFKMNALCRFCGGESVSIREVEKVGLVAVWSFHCKNLEWSSRLLDNSVHTMLKRNWFYNLNGGLVQRRKSPLLNCKLMAKTIICMDVIYK